ncbi:MAG: tRNA (adenosine(37)-N6)-threonylcarbamoyltransferase complex ATPase subunit type 1 TsaE [Firmicutes bacterium]|jgi:tRNA threonylcarbamoyladenosine biosynthesis protein TsaE|nr:tRNA (adenosine(37)-N6)-threonylcarbamoyltransferase complex ATPase subunit type 1 TsaE [Bacillota bacterium]MCL5063611.1 tRNA (adenosine(37)-N6)-threonylcarbamoyltransferase complex ATPase subunit type 1 TsaE [Bacillota bacterium]
MSHLQWEWQWTEESALDLVVSDLVQCWYPPAIILLNGSLGSGKTAITQRLFACLGVKERVKSPTFDLVHTYELNSQRLVHVDLYRLGPADDLNSLDLPKPDEAATMLVAEWGDALAALYPDRFDASIAMVGAGARRLTVKAWGQRSEARLAHWIRESQAGK